MSTKFVVFIRSVAFIGLAVVFGWNTSLWAKGHDQGVDLGSINPGLVKAFDSIGQNLFREGVFGASVVSVTDVDDMPAVQLDIRGYPTIPNEPSPLTLINVFDSETCQTVAQVQVGGSGDPLIIIDSGERPLPSSTTLRGIDVSYKDLSDFPPKPCQGRTPTRPGRDR
jgi:hypothetical protein